MSFGPSDPANKYILVGILIFVITSAAYYDPYAEVCRAKYMQQKFSTAQFEIDAEPDVNWTLEIGMGEHWRDFMIEQNSGNVTMEINSTMALKIEGTGPWSMDVNSTTIVRGSLSYPYPLEIELYSENNTTSGEFFFGWTFDGATDFDCESTAFFGTIAVGSSDVDIHVSRCIGPCRGYM